MTVQPCTIRVMGTRFLVRSRVARANSPRGMPGHALKHVGLGNARRGPRRRWSPVSMTVTSESDGSRNFTNRDRALVTSSRLPSGESASAQGLRLADRRFRSLSDAASITEMSSDDVLST